MLKGIPSVISPELLKVLDEMGHGDELVIGDCNYPAVSTCKQCIRADGISLECLLKAILELLPLDHGEEHPAVTMMAPAKSDNYRGDPEIWNAIRNATTSSDREAYIVSIERFKFYEKAMQTFVSVSSGEKKPYGCVILRKGIVSN